MFSVLRSALICCVCVFGVCATLEAAAVAGDPSTPERYRSDARLRACYWEGYSNALYEKLVDLAYGSSSIVNHGAARTAPESAWFADYRDGSAEASKLSQKFYERQMKELEGKRGSQ